MNKKPKKSANKAKDALSSDLCLLFEYNPKTMNNNPIANIGFEQYPGAQRFYQETAYSNISTNSIPLNVGVRYYFSPLLEQIVLLIPLLEVSASFTYFQVLHEFTIDSGLNNFKTESIKYGITAGAGISMFLMEIIAAYHYVENNQFVSFDLRVRIPLFVNL